ncbi:MAG: Asp-tRNA(Asn)/Glu-tRNA(Gln) amidotransferase subunit GatA [Candidatus Aenigmarchaeota archaeon]|nr:Asp-tRNA(Asn)/Glu-tRNA(Gln) amidotransferase subunit GatA [Candidatus Aenigmarchaeota archaeon]
MKLNEKVSRYLEKIPKSKLNAFISINKNAEKDAEKIQRKIDTNAAGRLAGYVLAIKDNIAVSGMRLTCASKMLENYVSPYDATVVKRIIAEDGLIIGKTNMDEFACGASGETSYFGATLNPSDEKRVPGGSSSGSAAVVAAGLCDVSLGSDTGGSIRCPSSFCGVLGFKPTYGTVSRYGLVDMAMSLDQIGPITKTVSDAALVLSVINGSDGMDNTAIKTKEDYTKFAKQKITGIKIGVVGEFFDGCDHNVEKNVRDGVEILKSEGAKIVDVSVPKTPIAVPAYYLNMFAEFSSAMQKFDGLKYGFRKEGKDLNDTVAESRSSLGEEVKRRILLGTYITMKEFRGKWYSTALKARESIRHEMRAALKKCDLLAGPTMPFTAFKLGDKIKDPVEMYLSDILTVSANLSGLPAASVPLEVKGMPVGMQLHADTGSDGKILFAAAAYERASK